VDPDWGWPGWGDNYPWGAGLVLGAAAAAIAYGSRYYALPPGCPAYGWGGYSYYYCDGVWYDPEYEGDTIVYVTVPDPRGGQAPAPSPQPEPAPAPPAAAAPTP
jgi:hypothetical protein